MKSSVFIVLGMHKSGTTLIADILHRSGIQMIEDEPRGSYDDGNKMERRATQDLNKELLHDSGTESSRLICPLSLGAVTREHRKKALALCDEASKDSLGSRWGFKDPRTLLTINFWLEILENPQLIAVFRDPLEVFQHYCQRAGRRWISRDPTYLPDALHSWCVYNQALIDLKCARPEMPIINYSEFMTSESGVSCLAKIVGRDLVDCRRQGMRRARAIRTTDYRIARQIVRMRNRIDPDKLYSDLCDLSIPLEAR